MPPSPRFTRKRLQAAALRIVDRQGVSGLSMRSLAAALRTGPMTLYNYVRNREELDALVVEAVMAEATWPAATGNWKDDVRAIATATWHAVRSHPNAIPLILMRRGQHESTLEPAEALLRALAAGGFSGPDLLGAFRAVHGFIMGFAQISFAARRPLGRRTAKDPTVAQVQALPLDRFPKLVEIANAAGRLGPDFEFSAGLEIVLAGLAAKAG